MKEKVEKEREGARKRKIKLYKTGFYCWIALYVVVILINTLHKIFLKKFLQVDEEKEIIKIPT